MTSKKYKYKVKVYAIYIFQEIFQKWAYTAYSAYSRQNSGISRRKLMTSCRLIEFPAKNEPTGCKVDPPTHENHQKWAYTLDTTDAPEEYDGHVFFRDKANHVTSK